MVISGTLLLTIAIILSALNLLNSCLCHFSPFRRKLLKESVNIEVTDNKINFRTKEYNWQLDGLLLRKFSRTNCTIGVVELSRTESNYLYKILRQKEQNKLRYEL